MHLRVKLDQTSYGCALYRSTIFNLCIDTVNATRSVSHVFMLLFQYFSFS